MAAESDCAIDGEDDSDEEKGLIVSVFIGNLPAKASAKCVHSVFKTFSGIWDVYIPRRIHSTPKSRFAFVHFRGESAAREAIKVMNGSWSGGRRLIVQRANGRKPTGVEVNFRTPNNFPRVYAFQGGVESSGKVLPRRDDAQISGPGCKSFVEAVLGLSVDNVSKVSPVMRKRVHGYADEGMWLSQSAAAVLRTGVQLEQVRAEILNLRKDVYRVSALDVNSMLVTFHSIDLCISAMLEREWLSWFQSFVPWVDVARVECNRLWIYVYCIPPIAWNCTSFKAITNMWSCLVEIDEGTSNLQQFISARLLISTNVSFISEDIELEIAGIVRVIRVSSEPPVEANLHIFGSHQAGTPLVSVCGSPRSTLGFQNFRSNGFDASIPYGCCVGRGMGDGLRKDVGTVRSKGESLVVVKDVYDFCTRNCFGSEEHSAKAVVWAISEPPISVDQNSDSFLAVCNVDSASECFVKNYEVSDPILCGLVPASREFLSSVMKVDVPAKDLGLVVCSSDEELGWPVGGSEGGFLKPNPLVEVASARPMGFDSLTLESIAVSCPNLQCLDIICAGSLKISALSEASIQASVHSIDTVVVSNLAPEEDPEPILGRGEVGLYSEGRSNVVSIGVDTSDLGYGTLVSHSGVEYDKELIIPEHIWSLSGSFNITKATFVALSNRLVEVIDEIFDMGLALGVPIYVEVQKSIKGSMVRRQTQAIKMICDSF